MLLMDYSDIKNEKNHIGAIVTVHHYYLVG